MADKILIAQCITKSGYGTVIYDKKTKEYLYGSYATVIKIISNKEYWDKYDSYDSKLSKHFKLECGYYQYILSVWSDNTKTAERLKETEKLEE